MRLKKYDTPSINLLEGMMKMNCPHCGVTGTAPESLRGRRVKCPKCHTVFEVGKEADDDFLGETHSAIDALEEHEIDRLLAGDGDDDVTGAWQGKGESSSEIQSESGLGDVLEDNFDELVPEDDADHDLLMESDATLDLFLSEGIAEEQEQDITAGKAVAEQQVDFPATAEERNSLFSDKNDPVVKGAESEAEEEGTKGAEDISDIEDVFRFGKGEMPVSPFLPSENEDKNNGELVGQAIAEGDEDDYDAYRNRVDALWDQENKNLPPVDEKKGDEGEKVVTCIACGSVIQPGEGYILGRNVYCVNCVPRRRRPGSDSKTEPEDPMPSWNESEFREKEKGSLLGKMFGAFSKKSNA